MFIVPDIEAQVGTGADNAITRQTSAATRMELLQLLSSG